MNKLHLYPVYNVDELVYPQAQQTVSPDTPAMYFFTDFSENEPLVIEADVPAHIARQMMMMTHVRLKLVVDTSGHFLGVVSAQDLQEQSILRRAAYNRTPREDVLVRELMTRRKDLHAFSLEEITSAKIRDVIDVLKDNHQQHCLVVDESNHQIRGIFSAGDISRKLRLPVDIQEGTNFSKVFTAVA